MKADRFGRYPVTYQNKARMRRTLKDKGFSEKDCEAILTELEMVMSEGSTLTQTLKMIPNIAKNWGLKPKKPKVTRAESKKRAIKRLNDSAVEFILSGGVSDAPQKVRNRYMRALKNADKWMSFQERLKVIKGARALSGDE